MQKQWTYDIRSLLVAALLFALSCVLFTQARTGFALCLALFYAISSVCFLVGYTMRRFWGAVVGILVALLLTIVIAYLLAPTVY